jgi:stage V sporulation protein AF
MGLFGEKQLKKDIKKNIELMKQILPIDKSFDVIAREIIIGARDACLIFIDGFIKDEIMIWILEALQSMKEDEFGKDVIKQLIKTKIGYIEVEAIKDIKKIESLVLSGAVVLFVDGENEAILIDVRQYPVRTPEEPDLEKVTRGSRDGLVETLIFNTALIRRRLRDPNLIFDIRSVGTRSRTDVVIAYIEGLVDEKLLS